MAPRTYLGQRFAVGRKLKVGKLVCHDGVGVAEGRRVWIGASKGFWGRMVVGARSGGHCGFVMSGCCCCRRVGFGAAGLGVRHVGFGATGVWVRRVGVGAAFG